MLYCTVLYYTIVIMMLNAGYWKGRRIRGSRRDGEGMGSGRGRIHDGMCGFRGKVGVVAEWLICEIRIWAS